MLEGRRFLPGLSRPCMQLMRGRQDEGKIEAGRRQAEGWLQAGWRQERGRPEEGLYRLQAEWREDRGRLEVGWRQALEAIYRG
jgi:hypothetical protein